jgi:hypothetical protein
MKKLFLKILFIYLLLPFKSNGQVNDLSFRNIIGKGIATNYNAAIELAKRDALERSVGVYISSETIIKNDQLLNDKIYSLSSGFVKKYDVISTVILSENATEVIISADISKDAIISEIKNAGIVVELNGGGLFEEFNQMQKYDNDEYLLFKSLYSNPSVYSPYKFSVEYDRPVFDEVNGNCKIKFHIKGITDTNANAILQKTKSILDNISYDNAQGLLEENTSYSRIMYESPEYKQLLLNYQSRTCTKSNNSHYCLAPSMLMQQVNLLKRKPYSPYLIGLGGKIYSVNNIKTYLFLGTFYFFYFIPNLKVEIIGNSGQLIKDKIINKEILQGNPSNINYNGREFFYSREFCSKTIEMLEGNFSFNLDTEKYKRHEYYDSESIDHDVFRFGNTTSAPYTPFLDLNCYKNLAIEYEFELTFSNSEIKNISKIQVAGLPVLLKLDSVKK